MAHGGRLLAGAVALTLAGVQPALAQSQQETGPSCSHSDNAAGGLFLGALGGAVVGGLGIYVGTKWDWTGLGDIGSAVFGGMAGYVTGITVGVGVAWHHDDANIPYAYAFAGAVAGGLAGMAMGDLIHLDRHDANHAYDHPPSIVVGLLGPIIGSSLAVYLAHRHPASDPQIGTLLELRDGELAIGIPLPARSATADGTVTMVPLVAGRF